MNLLFHKSFIISLDSFKFDNGHSFCRINRHFMKKILQNEKLSDYAETFRNGMLQHSKASVYAILTFYFIRIFLTKFPFVSPLEIKVKLKNKVKIKKGLQFQGKKSFEADFS